MILLNALKRFQHSVYKLLYFEMRFPSGVRSLCSSKFYSYGDRKSNSNFHHLTYGIGSGIGVAVLFGIFNHNQDSTSETVTIFENFKCKINLCAADFTPRTGSPRSTFNFLADVVEKTQKSVVYIEISVKHPLTQKTFPVSNGSGFIVKADGLILTSAHVVNYFGYVMVKLFDGREFKGVVEYIDTENDLATVRIQANNLPVLPLGNSSDLRPGEFVIAMGNPLALSHTITAGVVSSTNRQGEELGLYEKSDYIQTDAAINEGNSGGPLVNLDGEAIGINTMKVTEGISFAIPSDRAIEFLKNIEKSSWNPSSWALFKKPVKQKVQKFSGLGMLTLSPVVIKNLKESNPDFPAIDHGVLVWKVMIDSPSYECGIRPGDVIKEINGTEVYDAETIQAYLGKEDIVSLTIYRGQKIFKISVPLVETVLP